MKNKVEKFTKVENFKIYNPLNIHHNRVRTQTNIYQDLFQGKKIAKITSFNNLIKNINNSDKKKKQDKDHMTELNINSIVSNESTFNINQNILKKLKKKNVTFKDLNTQKSFQNQLTEFSLTQNEIKKIPEKTSSNSNIREEILKKAVKRIGNLKLDSWGNKTAKNFNKIEKKNISPKRIMNLLSKLNTKKEYYIDLRNPLPYLVNSTRNNLDNICFQTYTNGFGNFHKKLETEIIPPNLITPTKKCNKILINLKTNDELLHIRINSFKYEICENKKKLKKYSTNKLKIIKNDDIKIKEKSKTEIKRVNQINSKNNNIFNNNKNNEKKEFKSKIDLRTNYMILIIKNAFKKRLKFFFDLLKKNDIIISYKNKCKGKIVHERNFSTLTMPQFPKTDRDSCEPYKKKCTNNYFCIKKLNKMNKYSKYKDKFGKFRNLLIKYCLKHKKKKDKDNYINIKKGKISFNK